MITSLPKPTKKTRKMGKKPINHQKALKLADSMFSRLRRTEWCIQTGSLEQTYFRCVTCGNFTDLKNGDNGHCIPRGVMRLRFTKTNTAGQCGRCNRYGNGQTILFLKSIREREGKAEHDRLVEIGERNESFKYTTPELLDMARSYQTEAIKIWHTEGLAYPWPVEKIPEM